MIWCKKVWCLNIVSDFSTQWTVAIPSGVSGVIQGPSKLSPGHTSGSALSLGVTGTFTIALWLPPPSSRGEDGNLLKAFISNMHLPPFSLSSSCQRVGKVGPARNLLPACFLPPCPRDGGSRQVALRAHALPGPKVQEAQGGRRESLAPFYKGYLIFNAGI